MNKGQARLYGCTAVYLSKINVNLSKEIEAVRYHPYHTSTEYENDLGTICTYFLEMPQDATFVRAPMLSEKALVELQQKSWMKISYSILEMILQ